MTKASRCEKCRLDIGTVAQKNAHDASRDIAPHEYLAMILWGAEYAKSGQSARCFYWSLDSSRRRVVRDVLTRLKSIGSAVTHL